MKQISVGSCHTQVINRWTRSFSSLMRTHLFSRDKNTWRLNGIRVAFSSRKTAIRARRTSEQTHESYFFSCATTAAHYKLVLIANRTGAFSMPLRAGTAMGWKKSRRQASTVWKLIKGQKRKAGIMCGSLENISIVKSCSNWEGYVGLEGHNLLRIC